MANVISTDKAPAAIGPYSQAIEVNGMIYTSGMIPIDPSTGELVTGSVEAQAEQAISNLEALLAASGSSIEKAVIASGQFLPNSCLPDDTPEYSKPLAAVPCTPWQESPLSPEW